MLLCPVLCPPSAALPPEGVNMAGKENPSRPWPEIAKEVSEEQSPERSWELTIELDKALEAEENKGKTPKGASGSRRVRGSQS